VASSRALIESIRRELGSIHEKIVAHRYLVAIETGDLIYFDRQDSRAPFAIRDAGLTWLLLRIEMAEPKRSNSGESVSPPGGL
jgi:hypothetical protein